MAGIDIDDLEIFKEVYLDPNAETSDSEDEEDYFHICRIRKLPPPRERKPPDTNKFVAFQTYIQEKCENRIKILDRSTFAQIKRPIIIAFNHFREKCYYHTKWLDRLHQLSLKFGDRIEFIAADQFDLDLLYPQSNPIKFFCNLVSPERETPRIYAIDANKRILEYFDAHKTEENLSQLCENLLNGSLYKSQMILEKNEGHLVKICVAQNYEEMVIQSTKDILLIVGLDDYHLTEKENEFTPNFEKIFKQFENANLDIVYIDGYTNYVPFELHVYCYPKIMFIPHRDKKNFVELQCHRTDDLIEFIQKNQGPKGDSFRRQQKLAALTYQPFQLPVDTEIRFEDFEQYLEKYFPKSMKIFHDIPQKPPLSALIFVMDFQRKGLRYYLKTLQTINQVAAARPFYSINYLLADLKDIAKIFPKWYCKDLLTNDDDDNSTKEACSEIFVAVDARKWKYTFDSSHLKTPSSLFYLSFHVTRSELFYSQRPKMNYGKLVKRCTAHNIQHLIETCKKDIFLTLYRKNCEKSSQVLKALDDIERTEVKQMAVSLVKMDANLNSVPMEYSWPLYPVHFFIPLENRDEKTRRYICCNPSKEYILEFIRINKNAD